MLSIAGTLILLISCLFGIYVIYEISPPRGVKQIDVLELNKLLDAENKNDFQYIDVRPADEFDAVHVYGFRNIPLKELKNEISSLSKNKSVVVICERGNNSNEACRILKRHGFSNLIQVRGGIITWEHYK